MRLAKLRIKGYRSVKKEETLVTDERVTILIGANDHGKSNLLAAICCLNDEYPISADDRNWDLGPNDAVEIAWHFSPDQETIERLKEFGSRSHPASTNGPASSSGSSLSATPAVAPVADPVSAPDPPATATAPTTAPAATATNPTAPAPTDPPAAAVPPVAAPEASASQGPNGQAASATETAPVTVEAQPKSLTDAASGEMFATNGAAEIVFSRDLATNKVKIVSLPVPVLTSFEKDVLALRPRVELFESPSGNVVDQVKRVDLETPSFEFMQGIFRLAGLWDHRDQIFIQNDTTSKQLKEASAALTKILNDQWNQGKDLKWIFEHTGTNGDTIVIKIEDPAIRGRYTRPSLRSSGFRTYFLLSMIIYARSQNTPNNSHIYLFDEPGTYLHPSAQLDLQRSFETIADQAQLAYTTHSLFLISKNYPARNRVVSKTISGTKIDQKPFSKNWKSVRESLGILLSNNFLIAEKTLLVEGPSDAIYLLNALRGLKSSGKIDIDLNDMSIVDAGDSQNYVAMAKIMLSEGRSIVALADGDAAGKKLKTQLEQCCAQEIGAKKLQVHLLPENKSSEDIFADLASLRTAVQKSFQRLVDDRARIAKENMNIADSVAEIKPSDTTTLGKSIEEATKSWFVPKEKISKLLIAVLYEDEVESSQVEPPADSLKEFEQLKVLLELRSEKSKQSGVFEEVE